jgi:hypothetical protein
MYIYSIYYHYNCSYILPPFLFICRCIVKFYTIQRQIKRNGGSMYYLPKEKS